MGNEITKRYDLPKHHSFTGGPNYLYKVYSPAISKTTGEEVSIFVLDVDNSFKGVSKSDKEQLLDIFRKDLQALKEINHPFIIKILDSFEENTKRLIAFATEPFIGSLGNLMGKYYNLPQQIPACVASYQASSLEVGRGVCNLCEAIQYTHYVNRRLHMNVCPENIYVTPTGAWKLGGFGFSIQLGPNEVGPSMEVLIPYFQSAQLRRSAGDGGKKQSTTMGLSLSLGVGKTGGSIHTNDMKDTPPPPGGLSLEPNLAYASPELGTVTTSRCGYATDTFSAAVVCIEAFQMSSWRENNDGIGNYQTQKLSTRSNQYGANITKSLLNLNELSNTADHTVALSVLYPVSLDEYNVPDGVRSILEQSLAREPSRRPEPMQITQAPFFHTGPMAVLKELDSLIGRDTSAQATFLSSLLEKLDQFPLVLQKNIFFPPLLATGLKHKELWIHVIPILIKIGKQMQGFDSKGTQSDFVKIMQPAIKSILESMFKPNQINPQVLFLLANEVNPLLIKKCEHKFFVEEIGEMLYRGLDTNVPQVMDVVFRAFGAKEVYSCFDPPKLLQDLLPRLGKLIIKTNIISVRVNALVCLGKSYRVYGKDALFKGILPTLQKCLEIDKTPAVIMCVIGCYDMLLKDVDAECVSKKILPGLVPLLYHRDLSQAQFEKIASRVSSMTTKVIDTRKMEFGGFSANINKTNITSPSLSQTSLHSENDLFTDTTKNKSSTYDPPSKSDTPISTSNSLDLDWLSQPEDNTMSPSMPPNDLMGGDFGNFSSQKTSTPYSSGNTVSLSLNSGVKTSNTNFSLNTLQKEESYSNSNVAPISSTINSNDFSSMNNSQVNSGEVTLDLDFMASLKESRSTQAQGNIPTTKPNNTISNNNVSNATSMQSSTIAPKSNRFAPKSQKFNSSASTNPSFNPTVNTVPMNNGSNSMNYNNIGGNGGGTMLDMLSSQNPNSQPGIMMPTIQTDSASLSQQQMQMNFTNSQPQGAYTNTMMNNMNPHSNMMMQNNYSNNSSMGMNGNNGMNNMMPMNSNMNSMNTMMGNMNFYNQNSISNNNSGGAMSGTNNSKYDSLNF